MTEPAPFVPRPFRVAWWLRSAHAQTIGGKLFRSAPAMLLHRERWETPDGDFVDLDFAFDPGPASGARARGAPPPRGSPRPAAADARPLVLVLHGLEGSARRPYVLLTYDALARRGVRAVGLNFRGCSGEPNRLARFYHSGETGDAAWVLDRLHERFPRAAFGAVGFSLGGNVLLKLLGEMGERAERRLRAAAAVSVPFDLGAGSRGLERGAVNRLYTYYFMRNLRRKARAKAAVIGGRCDVDTVLAAPTLRAFDDAATAPLHGFGDAEEYYARSSSAGFLDRIRVPTLLIQSRDDPFLPERALPLDAIRRNPWLTAAFTDRGGHVGFIEGPPWAPRFWAEAEVARFLAGHLTATA